ncbi:hypothetical protein [Pseudomonas sp.]|uniref:hypothetical protein n=1 Tax=Pseudomonas sp. TaxID=306 RepID=UPI003FD71F4C
MKEFIVDFALYENGAPIKYLQQAWPCVVSDESEETSPFVFFMNYAKKYWGVTEGVRIINIWTIEV